ncbi:MAG TPA: hypothetical protein VFC78_03365, partial [Tepidisphaeraceae bacterium]|nr:hypothetical protein [Tepidisphaeraceae bacterium]
APSPEGDAAACAHGTAVAAIPCLLSTLSLGSLEPIRVNLPYPGRLWRDARADARRLGKIDVF